MWGVIFHVWHVYNLQPKYATLYFRVEFEELSLAACN